MAVLTVGQIVKRVGVLLDDPSNRRFTTAYIMPFIDQENESLEITLERLGIQQQEQIAIINLPAATAGPNGTTPPQDLAPFFAAGQPLQWFLRPKRIDWKVQGQPDVAYLQSDPVNELDDVQVGNLRLPAVPMGKRLNPVDSELHSSDHPSLFLRAGKRCVRLCADGDAGDRVHSRNPGSD